MRTGDQGLLPFCSTKVSGIYMAHLWQFKKENITKVRIQDLMGFPGDSVVKNPPDKQEMWVPYLGQEDPLEKEMAIHSFILAWEIPWAEEPGELQSTGSQRVRHDLEARQQRHRNLQDLL